MAPKSKGGAGEEKAKEVLTAVLLADSFTQRFRPITVEKPKVLLPLVNAPLLEYTLEWLALNKVEEIVVFCCAHADQIKAHLAEGKWLKQRSPRVHILISTNCLSLGEALRSLDQKDIIKSTFILVSGDTVSNMDLGPALAAHKERADKDKDAIMTMVMKPTHSPHQRLRLGDTNLLVAVDSNSQRLLKYQELEGPGAAHAYAIRDSSGGGQQGHHHHHHHHHRRGRSSQVWKLDASFWSERDCVQVRTDLMDTNISICSPEVLMMFSDNFDYQTLKRDFVVGTLSEEELGKKIYLHILQGEYAARIHNLRSYDAVSRDLLARWAFPFVPDTNVFYKAGTWGPSSYRYARNHKYLESVTSCSRTAQLGPCLTIGAGTAIGDGCCISHCVIGRGCSIGKHCRLTGCYLQDGVVLSDNVTASHALFCEGVVVGTGATILPGVVLSYSVVVGPKHTVPAYSVVSLCKQLNSEVSLSDDELEYTSAGRVSSSSGRPAMRRPRISGTGSAVGRQGRRQSSNSGSESSSSSSESGSSSESSSDDSSSSFGSALGGKCMEKPTPLAIKAAQVLAGGDKEQKAQIAGQVSELGFAVHLVGEGGAGYEWPATDAYSKELFSVAPPPMGLSQHTYDSDAEDHAGGGASDDATGAAARGEEHEQREGTGKAGKGQAALDPETVFMQEVSETFLRCVKERFAETNAVIELNGLKIAEDRTFADCARYLFTSMLQLCLPSPSWVSPEYRSLFPADAPDSASKEGKLLLLSRFKKQLNEWGSLLRRFLRNEDDQVELLLTLEEFCSAEGVFESGTADGGSSSSSSGAAFGPLFANLLQLLYDGEVVEEAAITNWAAEKEHADESEKVFLIKSAAFLEWLKTADEEEEDSDEESDEE